VIAKYDLRIPDIKLMKDNVEFDQNGYMFLPIDESVDYKKMNLK